MNTFKSSGPSCQRGMTLFVGLIMLLLLTILGMSLLWTTLGEERMAGNLLNKAVSFESAESGLRETVARIKAGQIDVEAVKIPDVEFLDGGTPVSEADYWGRVFDWEANGTALTQVGGVAAAPRFVIEKIQDASAQAIGGTGSETVYILRVTVRSPGRNGEAASILQAVLKE